MAISKTLFNVSQHSEFDTISVTSLKKREVFRHEFSDNTIEQGGEKFHCRCIHVKPTFAVTLGIFSVGQKAKWLISFPYWLICQIFLHANQNFAFKVEEVVLRSLVLELFMLQNGNQIISGLSNFLRWCAENACKNCLNHNWVTKDMEYVAEMTAFNTVCK